MPIKITEYFSIGVFVYQQETAGYKQVCKCESKAIAKRIAGLLNEDLREREKKHISTLETK